MLALELFLLCLWPCLSTFSLAVVIIVPWFFAESDHVDNLSEHEMHRSDCCLLKSVGFCYPLSLRKAGSLCAARWVYTLCAGRMGSFSFCSSSQNPVLKLLHWTALFMYCGVCRNDGALEKEATNSWKNGAGAWEELVSKTW